MCVGRAHDEIGTHTPFAEEGIAADLASFMGLFGIAEQLGNLAFSDPAADLVRQQGRTALQRTGQSV